MAWRVGVAVAGVAVIVSGLILVPLPGPGWLTVFAGLAVLGTEFEWANRLLRWVRNLVGRWWTWVALRPRWLRALIGLAGLVFLAALAYAGWLIAYR